MLWGNELWNFFIWCLPRHKNFQRRNVVNTFWIFEIDDWLLNALMGHWCAVLILCEILIYTRQYVPISLFFGDCSEECECRPFLSCNGLFPCLCNPWRVSNFFATCKTIPFFFFHANCLVSNFCLEHWKSAAQTAGYRLFSLKQTVWIIHLITLKLKLQCMWGPLKSQVRFSRRRVYAG
jgi:hypothetical protein